MSQAAAISNARSLRPLSTAAFNAKPLLTPLGRRLGFELRCLRFGPRDLMWVRVHRGASRSPASFYEVKLWRLLVRASVASERNRISW